MFRLDEPVANSLENPFTHQQHRFQEFSDFEVVSQAGIDPADATVPDLFQLESQPRHRANNVAG